jgi:hypothetical protein
MTETITTKEKTTNRIADRIAGTSPLVYARIAGLLLLIVAVLGPFRRLRRTPEYSLRVNFGEPPTREARTTPAHTSTADSFGL